jgi:hypothetical protein
LYVRFLENQKHKNNRWLIPLIRVY